MVQHYECLEALHTGMCPECQQPNEHLTMLNVERSHFGVCRKHRLYWPIGANLFSAWKYEREETWHRNEAELATMTEVEPVLCPCGGCVWDRVLAQAPSDPEH